MTNKVFTDYETVIDAAWLNDVNTTVNTTVPGLAATKAELAGSSTQSFAASELLVGDQGTEGSGINIGGVTYEASFKVSDIDGTNYAQSVFHRHSTTLEPLLLGARSNSDTSGHTDVTSGQGLFTTFASGVAGTNYKLFGASSFAVDTGTVSDTSAPGKWTLSLTPNGSTTLTTRLTVTSSGKTTISSTESLVLPTGTTAQRDATPTTGGVRFNTSYIKGEIYNGTSWTGLGGATGAGGDDVFYENGQTVTTSYTITTGKNAVTAGPVTINTGVVVTVPTGSRWTIV